MFNKNDQAVVITSSNIYIYLYDKGIMNSFSNYVEKFC